MGSLTQPVVVAGRTAPSRVVFGSHVTNLGRDRAFSDRHVAYYRERALGGCGIVVLETASVHPSDWPYERAPLAASCEAGWSQTAQACRPFGTLVLAGLGHTGGQGSSAYSQAAMWAPSAVADAISREMPMVMEETEIDALIKGFGAGAELAAAAGLDGVELDIGPRALLRQFHSGLTNHRDDEYGSDRLRLTEKVVAAIRRALGDDLILAVRLCADELAPWAGITPDQAAEQVATLARFADLVTVVRGGPFSVTAERPDAHSPAGFNADLCRAMRDAASGRALVVLQGSVVDPADAQGALDSGVADLVEMTRAQIAEPRLVALVRSGRGSRARPCILCNQACQVRDSRNPLVSCIGQPRSGYETVEPDVDKELVPGEPTAFVGDDAQPILVVGAGVAGLESARVLASRGCTVRVVDRRGWIGGVAAFPDGPGRSRTGELVRWLEAECRAHGVAFELGREVSDEEIGHTLASGGRVILATGSRPRPLPFALGPGCIAIDAASVLEQGAGMVPVGPVLVHDPVGGPIGVRLAEWLADQGREVALVTPDPVAGTLLSLTGDLADANTRLQRAGVVRELRSVIRSVSDGTAVLEHVWTGEQRHVPCASVIDCGPRLADEALATAWPDLPRAGDCVAPRTLLEAVLEGRRRALEEAEVPTASSSGHR